jgi:hypothetical protein
MIDGRSEAGRRPEPTESGSDDESFIRMRDFAI